MLLVVGAGVFLALALAGYGVLEQVQERASIRDSLRQLGGYEIENVRDQELLNPLRERALVPATRWLTDVGRRLTPIGYVDGIRRKLVVSGRPGKEALDKFLAIRVLTIAAIP